MDPYFSRGLVGRTQSADAALQLSRIEEASLRQDHPAYQQGSLVLVPAGRYGGLPQHLFRHCSGLAD